MKKQTQSGASMTDTDKQHSSLKMTIVKNKPSGGKRLEQIITKCHNSCAQYTVHNPHITKAEKGHHTIHSSIQRQQIAVQSTATTASWSHRRDEQGTACDHTVGYPQQFSHT